jgi:DNA-binding response OmpR family regulator
MNDEPRVLIVEDQDALRAMLFTVLRHQPLAVDTAASLEAALTKVQDCDYALILLDMNLEGGDAQSFLRQFREMRPEATTFIIAVRDPNKDVFINPDQVSAILNKPIEIDTMADVVRECAIAVPPPDDPLPCSKPAESDLHAAFERGGSSLAN